MLNIRIDKDQNFNSDSDVIKIETLKDGSIKYTLYHESKENSDYHKSDLDGVVSAAIATMYEVKTRMLFISRIRMKIKKVVDQVRDLDYVLDVSCRF